MAKVDLAYIIDDDEIVIYLTGELIKKGGFCNKAETFTNGLQAIERLKQAIQDNEKLPDVIFLDLNMPVMDGWEFADEFIKLPSKSKIPLFIFSSSINPMDKDKSSSFPDIKGFIQKPLTLQKLDKVLEVIS